MKILDAIADSNLFGPWFKDAATWHAWRAFLAALFGLPLDDDMPAVFRDCTGRTDALSGPFNEAGWSSAGVVARVLCWP